VRIRGGLDLEGEAPEQLIYVGGVSSRSTNQRSEWESRASALRLIRRAFWW